MSNYKKEAKHYRDVAQGIVNQIEEIHYRLIEIEELPPKKSLL